MALINYFLIMIFQGDNGLENIQYDNVKWNHPRPIINPTTF